MKNEQEKDKISRDFALRLLGYGDESKRQKNREDLVKQLVNQAMTQSQLQSQLGLQDQNALYVQKECQPLKRGSDQMIMYTENSKPVIPMSKIQWRHAHAAL